MEKYLVINQYVKNSADLCTKFKITQNQLFVLICVEFKYLAQLYKYLEESHPQASASLFMENLYAQKLVAFLGEEKTHKFEPDYAYIVNANLKDSIRNLFHATNDEISYLSKGFEKFFSTYPAAVTSDGKRLTLKAVPKAQVRRIYEKIVLEEGSEIIEIIQKGTEVGERNNLINCKITTYLESYMFQDFYDRGKKESRFDGLDSQKLSL